MDLLIKKGANIEAKDKYEKTPLHLAAKRGHKHIVALLISKGAQIEAKDERGRTPLYLAAEKGHESIVRLLKQYGAVDDRWCLVQ